MTNPTSDIIDSHPSQTIIIGGGLGGLFTGAMLAKNGIPVTVLEKNAIIGGGLQCFSRKGKTFETGMHILGGFRPGGTLYKICNWLGILDKLDIIHSDDDCMDSITVGEDGRTLKFAVGRDGFINSLTELFPEEGKNIRAYVDALYRLTEEVPLFHLRPGNNPFMAHSEEFTLAADEFIARYLHHPRLRQLVAYFNPLYGGVPGETPAYVHALISVLYINGPSRFAGGSQQLADQLKSVIEQHGGRVITSAEVTRIHTGDDGNAVYALTSDGRRFHGSRFISSVHPLVMARMLPDGTFTKAFLRRLRSIPLSVSAFSLFIDLKPESVEYINHTCYYIDRYDSIWGQYMIADNEWPAGLMYMTPPDAANDRYASRMLVHCVMDWQKVNRWEDSKIGQRPPEYDLWKEAAVEAVINKLERAVPGIRQAAANIYAASPLTVRDYYLTPEGAIFGYRKDCRNLMLSQIPVYTKVPNLLLTGQNINLHGICGVPLTAILTAEAILGPNHIVNQINHSQSQN